MMRWISLRTAASSPVGGLSSSGPSFLAASGVAANESAKVSDRASTTACASAREPDAPVATDAQLSSDSAIAVPMRELPARRRTSLIANGRTEDDAKDAGPVPRALI